VLLTFDGFHQPQGVRFDGEGLLVCDTVGGAVLAVALATGERTMLVSGLRSPWDCLRLDDGRVAIAEAGMHRIVTVNDARGQVVAIAGTGAEGLRDGPATAAHLAQPSGLTMLSDGAIAFADSEVSALRVLRDGAVQTLVGHGLFEWGAADGDQDGARLQHPLGVAALPGGGIAVADTFNSLLRIWERGQLRTLPLQEPVEEPGGLDILPDGRLIVADTNHHRVVAVDIATGVVTEIPIGAVPAAPSRDAEALTGVAGATLRLTAGVDLDGADLDVSQGPPVHVNVSADPPTLLGPGPRSWALDSLPVSVEVQLDGVGAGTLVVDVIASTCHGDVCTIARATREHSLTVT
jgi:hypothetical protein